GPSGGRPAPPPRPTGRGPPRTGPRAPDPGPWSLSAPVRASVAWVRRRAGSAPTLPGRRHLLPARRRGSRAGGTPRTRGPPVTGSTTAVADDARPGGRPASGTAQDTAYDPFARPTGWSHSRGLLFGEMLVFGLLSLTA